MLLLSNMLSTQHNAGVIQILRVGTFGFLDHVRICHLFLRMPLSTMPAIHSPMALFSQVDRLMNPKRKFGHDVVVQRLCQRLAEIVNLLVLELENLDVSRCYSCSFLTSHYQQLKMESSYHALDSEEGTEGALAS